ncbi:MAG: DUF6364 family protein [Gemmatimonadales bacterium]|jgi:hypothetical protein
MSRTKLTLSVDEEVVRRAKRFSRRHDTSLSRLVTDFLSRLVEGEGRRTPVVSRLRGILSPRADAQAYRRHLERKYRR